MRLTITTFVLCLINIKVWATFVEDVAPETTLKIAPSSIETIIPNQSYLLKLDCISCPYLVRHSYQNEWENDPRPNQLTLGLYIDVDGPKPRLYLQGEQLNPFWYERRVPLLYNLPHPFAPPFTANQIGANETVEREENHRRFGMPIRQFELAYEYDMVTYAPKDRAWEWEVLIEFEITGLRHEEHVRKDIPFAGSEDDGSTKGALPGVTSVVRVVLGYTKFAEMEISALELMPKDSMASFASQDIEALREAAASKGEKSITTADWGGRLRDINGPDMYTEHVSFQPGEWNDCGRKDEWGRQIMCGLDDFRVWAPVIFRVALVLMVMILIGMFVWVFFLSWLAVRVLRGRKCSEMVMVPGEGDALLLFGDEEIEEEEYEKKKSDVSGTEALG